MTIRNIFRRTATGEIAERLKYMGYFNRWVVFFFDIVTSLFATLAAMILINLLLGNSALFTVNYKIILISAMASAAGFLLCRTYKNVIRHSSFVQTIRIGAACFIKVALMMPMVYYLVGRYPIVSFTARLVLDFVLSFFLLISFRGTLIVTYRFLCQMYAGGNLRKDNLLLIDMYGGGDILYGPYLQSIARDFNIVGFITATGSGSLYINGYKAFPIEKQEAFNKTVDKYDISAILFPNPAAVQNEEDRLFAFGEQKKLKMLVMPSIVEFKKGKLDGSTIREVRIEDLLHREEITVDPEGFATMADKHIMVTGAAGSIGSELCRQLCRTGIGMLIMYDNAETHMHNLEIELREKYPETVMTTILGDVRNNARVERVMMELRPHCIFHAAAYKHVPLMEQHPCESVLTNVAGTMTVADAAVKYGVEKFVMISTDKAVNPSSVMGASKRLAEIYVQSLGQKLLKENADGKPCTKFMTTRFGNVLGSNGSVIPRFREQLAKGGPLTVTHPEIIRYFMTIPEACRLVLKAATLGQGREIFVFDMGFPVKIVDLARRMIKLMGLEPDTDIKIEYTGLRPGEKLYEELLTAQETTIVTGHEKIFIAKAREYEYDDIIPSFRQLCTIANGHDHRECVIMMKTIVPEFVSRQSEFNALDADVEKYRKNTPQHDAD